MLASSGDDADAGDLREDIPEINRGRVSFT